MFLWHHLYCSREWFWRSRVLVNSCMMTIRSACICRYACRTQMLSGRLTLATFADACWARRTYCLWGRNLRLRDEPKECLRIRSYANVPYWTDSLIIYLIVQHAISLSHYFLILFLTWFVGGVKFRIHWIQLVFSVWCPTLCYCREVVRSVQPSNWISTVTLEVLGETLNLYCR